MAYLVRRGINAHTRPKLLTRNPQYCYSRFDKDTDLFDKRENATKDDFFDDFDLDDVETHHKEKEVLKHRDHDFFNKQNSTTSTRIDNSSDKDAEKSVHTIIANGADLSITGLATRSLQREIASGIISRVLDAKDVSDDSRDIKLLAIVLCSNDQFGNSFHKLMKDLKTPESNFFVYKILNNERNRSHQSSTQFKGDIAVATPQNLFDAIKSGSISFDDLKSLVVLNTGNSNDVEVEGHINNILEHIRPSELKAEYNTMDNQIVILSSSSSVDSYEPAITYLKSDFVEVDKTSTNTESDSASFNHFTLLYKTDVFKAGTIKDLVAVHMKPGQNCIIFIDSAHDAEKLTKHTSLGLRHELLSHETHDDDRGTIIDNFENKEIDILIVTDRIINEIDLPRANLLIMMRPPTSTEKYASRIEKLNKHDGTVLVLATPEQIKTFKWILQDAEVESQHITLPTVQELIKAKLDSLQKGIDNVSTNDLDNVKTTAVELIAAFGVDTTLKSLLLAPYIRFHSTKSRSVMTANKAHICYTIEFNNSKMTIESMLAELKKTLGEEFTESMNDIYPLKNNMGLAVDFSESMADAIEKALSSNNRIAFNRPSGLVDVDYLQPINKSEISKKHGNEKSSRVYDYTTLVFRRLPDEATYDDVLLVLKSNGLQQFKLNFRKSDDEKRGNIAFVKFSSEDECTKAKSVCNNYRMGNRTIVVDYFLKIPSDRPPRNN